MNPKIRLTFYGQDQIVEHHQGIFWYLFSIDHFNGDLGGSLMSIICSKEFEKYGRSFTFKMSTNDGFPFLKPAFHWDRLSFPDFKMYNRGELLLFLVDYSKDANWGVDRSDFLVLMEKFTKLLRKDIAGPFYFISREWFDKQAKVLTDDNQVYSYYFLTIWFDDVTKLLNICEWTYD